MKVKLRVGIAVLAGAAILQTVMAYAVQSGQPVAISAEQYARLSAIAQSPSQSQEEEAVKAAVREALQPPTVVKVDSADHETPGP